MKTYGPKAKEKNLVLLCMPLMEKGVGSAWGLPVVTDGSKKLSALALSEKLEAPGILSLNGNPHRKEQVKELEALGIGPLGRYLGGETIKPVRAGPPDFFCKKTESETKPQRVNNAYVNNVSVNNAAALFCSILEFENTRWIAEGTAAELFHSHLEFLRTWGFSGGVYTVKETLPELLAAYLYHLQNETASEKTKIIALVSKKFFETSLSPKLPNAKPYGDVSAGVIPVNYCMEGKSAVRAELTGLSIVFYEELAAALNAQKIRCDICITVRDEDKNGNAFGNAFFVPDINSRLKLDITLGKERFTIQKNIPLNAYLYRNIVPAVEKAAGNGQAGLPAILPFPAQRKAEQHERRMQAGCSFEINAKFSGLRGVDFKEEQALFYREAQKTKTAINTPPTLAVPPVRYDAHFSSLNETQLDFFIRWRSECRRGFISLDSNSKDSLNYIENYIVLYAHELVLCMGHEGPLRHFHSLLCLFHACVEPFPETATLLCFWLLDFAVLYEITAEAIPLLLDELWNNLWFDKAINNKNEKTDLLIDLAICHFFVKKDSASKIHYYEPEKAWPLFKYVIPEKIRARKENDKTLPNSFCKTLSVIDARLNQDWDRGFFDLFYPPLPVQSDFLAFENGRPMGSSSYTAQRPGFSSHRPLLELCSALALEPETNPLPGVRARLHPINLENELLEELRLESDAVREILKSETAEKPADAGFAGNESFKDNSAYRAYSGVSRKTMGLLPESPKSGYAPPCKKKLLEFLALLDESDQNLIKIVTCNSGSAHGLPSFVSDSAIDAVNGAFYDSFGDILIETGPLGPSISAEYEAILQEWA